MDSPECRQPLPAARLLTVVGRRWRSTSPLGMLPFIRALPACRSGRPRADGFLHSQLHYEVVSGRPMDCSGHKTAMCLPSSAANEQSPETSRSSTNRTISIPTDSGGAANGVPISQVTLFRDPLSFLKSESNLTG